MNNRTKLALFVLAGLLAISAACAPQPVTSTPTPTPTTVATQFVCRNIRPESDVLSLFLGIEDCTTWPGNTAEPVQNTPTTEPSATLPSNVYGNAGLDCLDSDGAQLLITGMPEEEVWVYLQPEGYPAEYLGIKKEGESTFETIVSFYWEDWRLYVWAGEGANETEVFANQVFESNWFLFDCEDNPTPEPSITPTASATNTPTATATPTAGQDSVNTNDGDCNVMVVNSNNVTITNCVEIKPTASNTPTATTTPTITPTLAPPHTRTPTVTPTVTPICSPTPPPDCDCR